MREFNSFKSQSKALKFEKALWVSITALLELIYFVRVRLGVC